MDKFKGLRTHQILSMLSKAESDNRGLGRWKKVDRGYFNNRENGALHKRDAGSVQRFPEKTTTAVQRTPTLGQGGYQALTVSWLRMCDPHKVTTAIHMSTCNSRLRRLLRSASWGWLWPGPWPRHRLVHLEVVTTQSTDCKLLLGTGNTVQPNDDQKSDLCLGRKDGEIISFFFQTMLRKRWNLPVVTLSEITAVNHLI